MPKNLRGAISDFLTFILLQDIKKFKGGPFGDIKKLSKSQSQKQIKWGDPLVSSGFVVYVKKVKNERGTLYTKFASAGLGLRWFQRCS